MRFEDSEGKKYAVEDQDRDAFLTAVENEGKVVRELKDGEERKVSGPWQKTGSLAYMGRGEIIGKTYGTVALKAAGAFVKSIPNLIMGAAQGALWAGESIGGAITGEENHTLSQGVGKARKEFGELVDLFTPDLLDPNSKIARGSRLSKGGGFYFSELGEEQKKRIIAERGLLPEDFDKKSEDEKSKIWKEQMEALGMEKGYIAEDEGTFSARNDGTYGMMKQGAQILGDLKGFGKIGNALKELELARRMGKVEKLARGLTEGEKAGTIAKGTAEAFRAAKTASETSKVASSMRGAVPGMFAAERYGEMASDEKGPGGWRQQLAATVGGIANGVLFYAGLPFLNSKAASPFLQETIWEATKRFLARSATSGVTLAADTLGKETIEAAATAGMKGEDGKKVRWNPKTAEEIVKETMTNFMVGSMMHVVEGAQEAAFNRAYDRVWKESSGMARTRAVEENRKAYCPIVNRQATFAKAVWASGRPVVKDVPGLENVTGIGADGSVSFNDGSTWRPATDWFVKGANGEVRRVKGVATVTTGDGTILNAETGEVMGIAANGTTWETVQKTAMEKYRSVPAAGDGSAMPPADGVSHSGSVDWDAQMPSGVMDYLVATKKGNESYEAWKRAHEAWERDPNKDEVEEPKLIQGLGDRKTLSEEDIGWLSLSQLAQSGGEESQVAKAAMRDVLEGKRTLGEAWIAVKDALGLEKRIATQKNEPGAEKKEDFSEKIIVPTETNAVNTKPVVKENTDAENVGLLLGALSRGELPIHEDCEIEGLQVGEGFRLTGRSVAGSEGETAPVVVWIGKDGTRELITGSKRVGAAGAKGEKTVKAVYVREEDGWSREAARKINTVENLRDNHFRPIDEIIKSFEQLGVTKVEDLEELGIEDAYLKLWVKRLREASEETREALKGNNASKIASSGILDVVTFRRFGEERDAIQKWVIEKIIPSMGAEEANRILVGLAKRIDSGDWKGFEKEIENVTADVRRSSSEAPGIVADGEPVETSTGEMKTLSEVKAESEAPAGGVQTPVDKHPVLTAVENSGTNKGVELRMGEDGIMRCPRFENVRVGFAETGELVVEGLDLDTVTNAENIGDVAAFLANLQKVAGGAKIVLPAECRAAAQAIARELKTEGIEAYSQKNIEKKAQLIAHFERKMGKKIHTSAEDWEKGLAMAGEKAWTDRTGNIYGLEYGGEIYLNPTFVDFGTPIHEYGHLTIALVKRVNGRLIEKGFEEIKKDEWGRQMLERIQADEVYGKQDIETQLEEVLTRLIEMKGKELYEEKGLGEGLKAWLKEVWSAFKDYTGIQDIEDEDIANMTLDEIADSILAEMMSDRPLETQEGFEGRFSRRLPEMVNPRAAFEGTDENGNPKSESPDYWKEVKREISVGGKKILMTGCVDAWNSFIPDAKFTQPWPHASFYHPDAYVMSTRAMRKSMWPKSFEAGKHGNMRAALGYVKRCLNPSMVREMGDDFGDAYIVPVISHVKTMRNYIPFAYATLLAKETKMKLHPFVYQTSTAKSRNGSIEEHLFNPRDFGGKVIKGARYVLADDHNTVGFTAMAMKNFIEANGGVVVGYTCLTMDKRDGRMFAVADSHAKRLRDMFPGMDIDKWLRDKNICSSVEALPGMFVERVINDRQGYGKAFRRIVEAASGQEPARIRARFDGTGSWLTGGNRKVGKARFTTVRGSLADRLSIAASGFRLEADPVDPKYELTEKQYGELENQAVRYEDLPNWDEHVEEGSVPKQAQFHFARGLDERTESRPKVDQRSKELAKRLADGDVRAGDELIRKHDMKPWLGSLFGFLKQEDLEEIEQEGWLNVVRDIQRGKLENVNLSTLMFNQFKWTALNYIRRMPKESAVLDAPVDEEGNVTAKDRIAAGENAETVFREVLMRFDEKTRQMLELKAEGAKNEEIARRFHVDEIVVSRWINIVKEDLKSSRDPASTDFVRANVANRTKRVHVSDVRREDPGAFIIGKIKSLDIKEDLRILKHGVRGNNETQTLIRSKRAGLSNRKIAQMIGVSEVVVGNRIRMLKKYGVDFGSGIAIEDRIILKARAGGLSNQEIGKILKISGPAVGMRLKKLKEKGIEVGERGLEEQMTALQKEIVKQKDEGKSIREIADALGRNYNDVLLILRSVKKKYGELNAPSGKLIAMLKKEIGADETIDESVFVENSGQRILAIGDMEQKSAGISAALERRDALRPKADPKSPASETKPIAFDGADLVGFVRQLTGEVRPPVVEKDLEYGSLAETRSGRIGIVAKVFGVLDEGDTAATKNQMREEGYFAFEEPTWARTHSRKEFAVNVRESRLELDRRLENLFRKRVTTGEGGEFKATQVLAHEIGRLFLWQKADGGTSAAIGGARRLFEKMGEEIEKPRNSGLLEELEKLSAWWNGQTEVPPGMKGNAQELTADAFGILLTQPETLQSKAPVVYEFVRHLMSNNRELAEGYRKFCESKWNGSADDRLMREIEKTWDEKTAVEIAKIERKANEKTWTWKDAFVYNFTDRFGPMFMMAERSLKEVQARLDFEVANGIKTREMANEQIEAAKRRIEAMRSGLYDYQRSADGEERLMVSGFKEVLERAKESNVNWFAVRRYAHLMRVIEIGGRATAHNVTPDRAARLLERMREKMGDEAYLAVETTWKAFRAVYERFVLDDKRVQDMFDARTNYMLRKNAHYVTMRHTLSAEEVAKYEQELAEYKAGSRDVDPTLDIYIRINHGLGGQGEPEGAYELKPLMGSFDATKDPIKETMLKAVEIKRAAIRNELVRNLRDVLLATKVKGVFDKVEGNFRNDRKLGSLTYMENGKRCRLVVPKIIADSFHETNSWKHLEAVGVVMRTIKNMYTLWNPMFQNRALLIDKNAVETNMKGMRKSPVNIVAEALPLGVKGTPLNLNVPNYLMDNYLSRFTAMAESPLGKMLYGENSFNHYQREAKRITSLIFSDGFGKALEEAKVLRLRGETSRAAEIENRVLVAKTMLEHNVFQSTYKFDRAQKALSPEDILRAYGIPLEEQRAAGVLAGAWQRIRNAARAANRFVEEQEALTKTVAWLYDSRMNPDGDLDARARLVIEQGGTPNLGRRGVLAAHIENATGLFWATRLRGALRTVEAMRDHPAEWFAKAGLQSVLPSVLRGLAVTGALTALVRKFIFDDDDRKMKESALSPVLEYWDWYGKAMQNVPGYQQRNYNIIPLWTSEEGGTLALRIKYSPEEFWIQNAIHAAMNRFAPDPTDPDANPSDAMMGVLGEFFPNPETPNPAWTLFTLTVGPFVGYNPEDHYRKTELYSQDAFMARWKEPKYVGREWAENMMNYSPLGNLVGTVGNEKETGGKMPGGLAAVLKTPIVSRLPASMLGYYASPRKGAMQGLKNLSEENLAVARLKAQDALFECMKDRSLNRAEEHLDEALGENADKWLKEQARIFLFKGWRKWNIDLQTTEEVKLWKETKKIKQPIIKRKAIEMIERALKEDD